MSALTRSLSLALILSLLAVGTWVFWDDGDTSPDAPPADRITQEATRGTEEDPDARRNYEIRRLRDPETGQIPKNVRKKNLAFAEQMPERLRKSSAGSWRPRGPVNVGGRSRALEIDVSDNSSQTILAGGVSGGMWRTTDGGTTWTRTFAPDQRPNVTALDQDTRSGRQDVWFAGTGEYFGNSARGGNAPYRGNGIYKSVDGGQSWTLLSSTTGSVPEFDRFFDYTWAVEVDPSAPTDGSEGTDSEVYAATYGRIQRSMDGGSSWTAVLRSDPGGTGNFAAFTDVVVTSSGRTYAALSSGGNRNGIFMSATGDPGSWTDITPDGWPFSFGRTVLAVNPSNENEVWALTNGNASGPNGHALWKYNRSTETWTNYTDYLPVRGGATGTFNSQGGYDLIAEVHPSNGDIVFVGGRNLWRIDMTASPSDANTWIGGYTSSNNGFGFYNPPGSDPHHPDQHALAFKPGNGDVMYVGSDGGIHRTDNNRAGDTGEAGDGEVLWTDLNNGYFTTQFYAVCQFPSPNTPLQRAFIAGGMQDNGTWGTASEDVSDPWTKQVGADGGYCALTNDATDDSTSRYVSTQGGRVFRLIFHDGSFQGFAPAYPSSATGQLFINPFALDPSAADVMYYPAGSNLWRNNDLETNPQAWVEMTGAEVSQQAITALGVSDKNSAHVLYYGTDQGALKKLDDANSTAPETTPTDVTGASFPANGYVSSIAVDPTDSGDVMVVFSNYGVKSLFYSTDGGSSWTAVEGNLGADEGFSPSVRSAAILPRSGGDAYYVGTSIGVYSTTTLDGANTSWMQEGASEIGDVVVDQVQARTESRRVIVGTHANGTYDLELDQAAPIARVDSFSTPEGQTLSVSAPGVLGNDDSAGGDSLTATLVSDVSHGALTLNGDGSFEYTPTSGFAGTDSFAYEASDGSAADTATVHLQVGGDQITREVTVASGWNLLSVPLAVTDPAFGAVLPLCGNGFFFEPGTGYTAIDDGEAVPVGRGLFANCSAGTIEITGQAPTSSTVAVTQGWNIIGPLADSIDVGAITSEPAGIVTSSFFRFNPGGGYAASSTLTPGGGYWVKVSESGTLDVSGAGGGAALASAQAASVSQKQPGVELRLTDAAGRTASLRLATDVSKKRLQRHALPPTPPSGVFDVRFESGRSVAETGEGTDALRAIETQGLEAPVTVEIAEASDGQSLRLRNSGETTRLTEEHGAVTLSSTDDLAVGLRSTPDEFVLEKTFPNPTSGRATVAYAVPKPVDVTVAVYDVLGRRVATLQDGSVEAGRHTARLDAGQLPSGTYFVRMRAEGFRQTRQVTVVR